MLGVILSGGHLFVVVGDNKCRHTWGRGVIRILFMFRGELRFEAGGFGGYSVLLGGQYL